MKLRRKKLVGSGSRTEPGSIIPDADPDPYQNETDPKHWLTLLNPNTSGACPILYREGSPIIQYLIEVEYVCKV